MSDRPFVYGQKVKITSSNPNCNVEGYILDRMSDSKKHNFYRAFDIFKMDRSENKGLCSTKNGDVIHVEAVDEPNFYEAYPEQAPYAPPQTKLALGW